MLYIIFIYITGTQSGLEVYFHLKRHIGFFMLQVCERFTRVVVLMLIVNICFSMDLFINISFMKESLSY